MSIKAGIIGCGRPGGGMARLHARGYQDAGAQLAAIADISQDNMDAFRATYGGERTYLDYHELLKNEQLDIVSICTWPHLHAPMVMAAAESGVRAIHCEKPMATSYGEAKRMAAACEANGVQLTINHQRRFGEPFVRARQLLGEGAIGKLQRIEAATDNLYDWGTHWFDAMFFYNDDVSAEWVLAQIEWREAKNLFGVAIENQGLAEIGFANGVLGLIVTGDGHHAYGARNRLVGSEGIIEVAWLDGKHEAIHLRILNATSGGWKDIEMSEGIHDDRPVGRGIADAIDALQTGREPALSYRKALRATEVIFGAYESSRRRGKVTFPLDVDDSALLAILQENNAVPTN